MTEPRSDTTHDELLAAPQELKRPDPRGSAPTIIPELRDAIARLSDAFGANDFGPVDFVIYDLEDLLKHQEAGTAPQRVLYGEIEVDTPQSHAGVRGVLEGRDDFKVELPGPSSVYVFAALNLSSQEFSNTLEQLVAPFGGRVKSVGII